VKINVASGPLYPIPSISGGAMARVWEGLATAFAEQGHDVCVVARRYPGQADHEYVNGVEYLRWGGFNQSTNIYADLAKDFAYAVGLVPRLPAADILVTNDFFLPMFAGWLNPKAGIVVVSANRFPKRQFSLYGRVGLVAAASTAVADAIKSQTPSCEKITVVIPNPIDTKIFLPRQNPNESTSSKRLLFVGRVHPEKGVHLLIDAMRHIAGVMDVELDIVGPWEGASGGGGQDYLEMLKAKSQGLKVCLCGPEFDANRLAQRFQQSDLFCYPSIAESGEAFGVAPLEAMATGLVPVVSRLACFQDFIVEGESGFYFDHRSKDASLQLGKVILDAFSDNCRLRQMSHAAIRASEGFGFKRVAEKFLHQFAVLLTNNEPKQRNDQRRN
jgi:glycosyltransferase involved in cell wall biosynthesis